MKRLDIFYVILLCVCGSFSKTTSQADKSGQCLSSSLAPAKTRPALRGQLVVEALVTTWNDLPTWPALNVTSSTACQHDVERAIKGYHDNELWALQLFDSWAKPGPSLLEARTIFHGNYRQCRETRGPPDQSQPTFGANYCVVYFRNLTTPDTIDVMTILVLSQVQLGSCLPDSCSNQEITELFQERLQKLNATKFLQAMSTDCLSDKREYNTFTVVSLIIVSVIGFACALGTAWDLCGSLGSVNILDRNHSSKTSDSTKKTSSQTGPLDSTSVWKQILLSFSVYTNGRRLLDTSIGTGSLSVVPGIRFLTMVWITVGHTFFNMYFGNVASNAYEGTHNVVKYRVADMLVNMTFGVDSFFAISGLLVAYLSIENIIDQGWRFNWKRFILHRYWRLTPVYITCLVLMVGFQGFLVSGALAPTLQPSTKEGCERNWWLYPLYVNNLFRMELGDQCFNHAWSLAADFQFYLLSPLMLIPFHYHRLAGVCVCLVLVVVQAVLASVISYITSGTVGMTSTMEWFKYYYFPFYTRFGPFVVGILSGYLLAVNKKRITIPPVFVQLGWMSSLTAIAFILFGFHGDYSGENPSSILMASLFNGVGRIVWGAAVCWVIVACSCGYGGPVTTILSWAPFQTLGRLTYVGYLVSMSVEIIIFQNMDQPVLLNLASIVVFGVADVFFTCLVAAVLVVCVEFPTLNLEKIFRHKKLD